MYNFKYTCMLVGVPCTFFEMKIHVPSMLGVNHNKQVATMA